MIPDDRNEDWRRTLVDTLVSLADTLTEDFDVVEFLHTLTQGTVQLGLAAESGILLADADDHLHVMAASRERTRLLELFQLQSREGPCLDAWRSGVPVVVDDLEQAAERWPTFVPEALSVGFRSVFAVPLSLRDRQLGALNLFNVEVHEPVRDDRVVTQGLADIAAIGLLQHRTLLESQLAAQQLQNALKSRIMVEQAKGILAERYGGTIDESFERLRAFSRDHNRRLSDVARLVVDGVAELPPVQGPDTDGDT